MYSPARRCYTMGFIMNTVDTPVLKDRYGQSRNSNFTGKILVVVFVAMIIAAHVANGYSEDYYEGNPAAVFALMGPAFGLFAIAGLLGLAFLLWIGIADSQKGENRFGPNPKGE